MEGEIRVWRLQKPPLPDAFDVPAHEGSRDVAVPWEAAPSSSVAREEETPPRSKNKKEGSGVIFVDNQLEKTIGGNAICWRKLRYVVF
jgi:hypothetical protein